jgi:hypothetical protein
MIKVYIEDFCHDLNNKEVVLYIGEVKQDKLKQQLVDDCVNYIHRFDDVVHSKVAPNLMRVEKCDLKPLEFDVLYYVAEGYTVLTLHEDRHGSYYVEVDI